MPLSFFCEGKCQIMQSDRWISADSRNLNAASTKKSVVADWLLATVNNAAAR
jgi:hypothetical protein